MVATARDLRLIRRIARIASALAAVSITPALVLLFRLVDTDQLGHE